MIDRLQYITQDHEISHEDLCREACEAGVNWVQLRMKNASDATYEATAKACREITRTYNAKLIINDRLDLALACGADGVHLGLEDLDTGEARKQVPEGFIIGGTANTFEQIQHHYNNGVDYVGVGPFRFTITKNKLSPILGLEGYREILGKMKDANIQLPLIAIGGILTNDVSELIQTKVHGIAISGLITNASDKTTLVKELINSLRYATA